MFKQKLHTGVWIFLLMAAAFLVPQTALAQLTTPSQTMVSGATTLVTLVIGILNFLAWLVLAFLDLVMDPQVIFGIPADGGEGPLLLMLREIWQFTRDLVNLGFALGLIVGAVMMIVTADGTKIKEHLPKFALAIVLVNFSWFIPRVIFDLAQVATYTVYQIPSMMGDNACTIPPTETEARRPCDVILKFKFFEQTNDIIPGGPGQGMIDESDAPATVGWKCPLPSLVCYQTAPINSADAQIRTSTKVLHGLIVNHARLQSLAQVRPLEAEVRLREGVPMRDAFNRLTSILIKLVIALIIHVAIVFPLLAMAAAFFIRIPVLWVSMAFMPLVALGFAFPKLREGEYADLFWKWQEHFLQAVFLPVKVAIPFTIGFIMLNASAMVDPGAVPEAFRRGTTIPLFVDINNWWQFLWMGVAIFIIWKYSFDALSGEKAGFMGMFTEKIKSLGSSLGSVALQIPTSIPFIPVPGRTVPDATGKQVQERMSLGQTLRGIDPRLVRDDLRLGRFGSFGNRAGLQGSRTANPEAVNQINSTSNVDVRNRVTQNLNVAVAAGTPDAQQKGVRAVIQDLQRNIPILADMRDDQIIENLVSAGVINAERRKQIEDILRRERGAAGGGTPTPTPTPRP
ncbi:MAG: hypothetical protein HOO67_03060 [Candidatus Peribacteraceae bacterium]|nr:hypothetical protein [Candidatus Peribacteraceae bacterium]